MGRTKKLKVQDELKAESIIELPFAATWMDLEIVIVSEVSQTEKDKIPYDITYMWNQQNTTN